MAGSPPSHQRALATILLISLGLLRPSSRATAQQAADSADVAIVVTRFHQALTRGDSAGALKLLAPDAVILEAGEIESREDYRSHHLKADIAFAGAVPSVASPIRVVVVKDIAWATSTSRVVGTFQNRPVDSQGAELVVLSRAPDGWRIRAIHWSSRTRRPDG